MKKAITALLLAALILSFSACGETAVTFPGEWELDSADAGGYELKKEQLNDYGLSSSLILNEDKTATYVSLGMPIDAEWEEADGTTIKLSYTDPFTNLPVEREFKLQDKKLVHTDGNATTLYYVKK